jgi:hypothetical protein
LVVQKLDVFVEYSFVMNVMESGIKDIIVVVRENVLREVEF